MNTQTVDYGYTEAEADFYNVMSEFILDGRAYASDLAGRERTSRMLLLIALQKLAASSIAAIRSALSKRRGMLATTIAQGGSRAAQIAEPPEDEEDDERSQREESALGENSPTLMSDEIARLDEILARADEITHETKIQRLIDLIETELPVGEPVLLFTEYKATQALVLNALEARFGEGSSGFINGDERLTISNTDGTTEARSLSRDTAAEDFNAGRTRFLISTEAGGEGIDLQHRCATLVHVDLPWNPMRLHQRVGRLNRYGQTRAVSVYLLRNPETVEARIWSLLEEKLARIQATLSASMEEAEDIAQLVIGMAGSSVFDELYSEGFSKQGRETLKSWWSANSNRFGGDNALATARSLFGSASKYDSVSMAKEIPQLDLPQLEPFFRNAAKTHGRRVTTSDAGLSIATPEIWRNDLDLKSRYDGLTFDRDLAPQEQMNRMMGIGHSLVDKFLEHAINQPVFAAYLKDLENMILLARVEDELTGTKATVHRIVLGVQHGQSAILRDGELLSLLNRCTGLEAAPTELSVEHAATLRELSMQLEASELPGSFGFTYPKARPIMALVPASNRVL